MVVKSLMLIASSALLFGSEPAKEMADQEKIQGTWQLVAATRNGTQLPAEVVKSVQLVFAENKLKTKSGERESDAKFKLNSSEKPKEIDLDMEGNAGLGIYELDGDNLKIIHGEVGEPRPKEFESKPGMNLTLLVLKRAKPEKK